jgi:hypothetical protein
VSRNCPHGAYSNSVFFQGPISGVLLPDYVSITEQTSRSRSTGPRPSTSWRLSHARSIFAPAEPMGLRILRTRAHACPVGCRAPRSPGYTTTGPKVQEEVIPWLSQVPLNPPESEDLVSSHPYSSFPRGNYHSASTTVPSLSFFCKDYNSPWSELPSRTTWTSSCPPKEGSRWWTGGSCFTVLSRS